MDGGDVFVVLVVAGGGGEMDDALCVFWRAFKRSC
jgi:hypothetical protein